MKEEEQKSIVIYKSWKKPLRKLSLEQKGRIFDALLDFPDPPNFEDDQKLEMAWDFMSEAVESNSKKWNEKREKRAAAGRKGAEVTNGKRQQNAANPANADFDEQKQQNAANPAVSVNGNGNVNGNVNGNGNGNGISPNGDIKKGVNAPIPTPENKTARFRPPDMAEVKAYFTEKGGTTEQAKRFLDFYESNGWKVGKNPMKNWKAAASGWISRDRERQKAPAFQRNPVRYVSRPPEEAEKSVDFMRDAPYRTMKWLEKRKKEEENAPIQSDP